MLVKNNFSSCYEFIKLNAPYKKKYIFVFALIMLHAIINVFFPILSQKIVDDGFVKNEIVWIIFFALLLLLLYVFDGTLTIFREKICAVIQNEIGFSLRKKAFTHLLLVEKSYFYNVNETELYAFIEDDISRIIELSCNVLINACVSIFSAIGGGFALFWIDWRLGIIAVIYIPINYLITESLSNKIIKVSSEYIKSNQKFTNWFGDTICGINEIRLFNLEEVKTREFRDFRKKLMTLNICHKSITVLFLQLQVVLVQVLIFVIYVISGILLNKNLITIGGIVAFESYALLLSDPVSETIGMIFNIRDNKPSIRRFIEFLHYPEESLDGIKNIENGDIEFTNVSFSHSNGEKILSNVNIKIHCGEKIAIIGSNGVGKSTFIKLLLREYDWYTGNITINNVDIKNYELHTYRKLFSVVPQKTHLFNDTIRNNICMYNTTLNNNIWDIINMVGLDNLIKQKGLDYVVGNNDGNLSGGQKQKIANARAIATKRPIIILDEADASLDKYSIDWLIKLLKTELLNSTVICITHSYYQLKNFDCVYKLIGGELFPYENCNT